MIAAWNINRLSLGSTPPFLTRFLNWSTLCQWWRFWYKLIQVTNVSWFPLFLSCGISLVEPMATWLQKFWKKVKHMTPVLTGFLWAACCSNCLWGRYINKFSLNSSIPWRKKRNPNICYFGSISETFQVVTDGIDCQLSVIYRTCVIKLATASCVGYTTPHWVMSLERSGILREISGSIWCKGLSSRGWACHEIVISSLLPPLCHLRGSSFFVTENYCVTQSKASISPVTQTNVNGTNVPYPILSCRMFRS